MSAAAGYLHPTVERLVGEGRIDRALEILGDGALRAQAGGLHEEFVSCLVDRAMLLRYRGDDAEALIALEEADESIRHIEDPETVVLALRMRAALTSPAWTTIERLEADLLRSAARGDEVTLAAWAVADEATSLLRARDVAGAATLYVALAQTEHPAEVSGVPLAPAVGLATALRELGCLAAATAVLLEAEDAAVEADDPVRRCLHLAERCRQLAAIDRHEAAEDLRRELATLAPAALGRIEGRVLELSRGGRTRPTTFLVAAIHHWESIGRALGDRNAVVRCWLAPEVALSRIGPEGDDAARVAALRLLAETALMEGCDRLFRRARALQTIVAGGTQA